MKIITMECRTVDGAPVEYGIGENGEDYRDWWCVIETEEEKLVYDLMLQNGNKEYRRLWNYMVINAGKPQGLAWGDDDVYGYILPHEACPEIGEEFIDGDNDKWVRIS